MDQDADRRRGSDRRNESRRAQGSMPDELIAVLRLVGDLRTSDDKASWWSKLVGERRGNDRRGPRGG